MKKGDPPLTIERCVLTGEEYLRADPEGLTLEHIARLTLDEFRDIVILALKEHGHTVYPLDTNLSEPDGDFFMLESQKAEPGVWSVISWSLFACFKRKRPVGEEAVRRLHKLIVADKAEGGVIISTATFTKSAQRLAKELGIELIDGGGLHKLITDASTTGPYSPSCSLIPEELREELLRVKKNVSSLNEAGNQITGKWTAPLHLEKIVRGLVTQIVALYAGTPDSKSGALTERLIGLTRKLTEDILTLERDFSSIDTLVNQEGGE